MVEIYGISDCVFCKDAQLLCVKKNLSYLYVDMERYSNKYDEIRDKLGNFKTVPQIIVDGYHVGGFTEFKEYIND